VVDAEGVRRHDYLDATFDDDHLTATDDTLKPYSAAYLEYVSGGDLRVSSVFFNGQCGCSGGSNGAYTIAYEAAPGWSNTASTYQNSAATRVIVTRPDTVQETQYFDEAGQPLAKVTTTGSLTGTYSAWAADAPRDASGLIESSRSPFNASAYAHSTGAITAKTGDGRIDLPTRETSGALTGLPLKQQVKKGTTGTATDRSKRTWGTQSLQIVSGTNLPKPHVTGQAVTTGGGVWDETTVTTTFWSATNTSRLFLAPKKIVTTFPVVTTAKNGSNAATSTERYIRQDDTTAFALSATGTWTYTEFNTLGQLTKRIDDAQTNHASDFDLDPSGDFGITESGTGDRVVTTYAYDAQGRPDTTTHADGLITKMYYGKIKDGRMVTIACPRMTASGTTTYYGPMSYTVSNLAGQAEFTGTVAISLSGITTALTGWIDETDADPITALDIGTLARMSTSVYTSDGHRLEESRAYHVIPASGTGTSGTNYDSTLYGYDDSGRQRRVKNPAGTITRTTYDALGRFSARWIGTCDSSFPGGDAGTDNMVKVEEVYYDGASSTTPVAGGNSLVTTRTAFVQDSTTNQRQTTYSYDDRDRLYLTAGPQAPYSVTNYDNLDRATASAQYTSTSGITASTDVTAASSSNRIALARTFYDEKGQVYESRQYQINQSTGAIVTSGGSDVYLPSLSTYDAAGRVIRTRGTSLSKTIYDRQGRAVSRYTLAKDNDSAYADADDVAGDTVLEESHTLYQDSTGLPLFTHSIQRNFDDSTTTGGLDTNADADSATVTAANIKGRVSITAFYYDAWRRQTDVAAYGTNAIVGDGSTSTGTFTRPGSVPSRSDTILVTTSTYDTDGTVQQTTDPRGLVTRTLYDQAGRAVATIRNYVNGTPSGVTGDDDVYTRFTYSAGRMTEMWVDFDGDGVKDAGGGPPADQVTTYTYGVTKGVSAGDSLISSNDLLWKVTYPDSASGTDLVTFAYNAQGQEIWKKDQAGNILETEYDTAGRKTDTRATTINTGAGFDDAVKRITLAYLSRGLVDTVTQRDATTSGSVLNEVKYEYDDWGNISKMYQDRDSAVSAGNNEAQVAFAYSAVTTADGSKRARVQRDSMTNPKTLGAADGAVVAYTFGAGGNIAETFGRVSKVSVGGTDVASYEYQGAGMLVTTALKTAAADTSYRLHSGTSGSGFSGYLDNLGRVTRSQWKKLLGSPVTLYDLTLTYDRDGNITSADDAATGGSGAGWDVKYGMDSLNRLTDADEGTLSAGTIGSRTRRERWDQNTSGLGLDQVGNWSRRKLDLNGDGDYVDAGETDDTGAFNTANEWHTRDVDSNSSTNYTLAHDAVGNMTDDGKDYTYVYDVFGRLVKVKARSGGATVAEYGYDGLGQRIWFHADEDADGTVEASNDDPRYNYVYDDRWRIVAVYRVPYSGSDTTPKETYVWHMAGMDGRGGSSYIDTVILRDRDNTNGWTGAPDGTLEERRFYLQNWRADVSAVCNTNGRPLERVKYSAYGVPITLTELDFNLDGNIDPDDPSDFIGAPDDWDLDGDTDASDSTNFAADYGVVSGNTYGRAVLSLEGVRNILGYAGYVGDRFIRGSGSSATEGGQGFKWHVRHRVLDSGIGRWTRRDPLGYVDDAANLHQYAENDPINKADADGLDAGTCTLGTYVVCSAAAAPAGPVLICCTFIVVPVAAGCAGYSIGCYIRDNLMPGPVNLPPLPRSTPPPSNITYYGRCLAMYLAYKAACALCSRCNGTTSPTVACTMAACWMNCAIMRSAFTATACPNANSPGHKQAVFDAFGAAGNCYSRCIVSD